MAHALTIGTNDDSIVVARCTNCVGLLKTKEDRYLPMQAGDWFKVFTGDVHRWRLQGYKIEVQA